MAYQNHRVSAWDEEQAVPRTGRQERGPHHHHHHQQLQQQQHPANQFPANLRPRLLNGLAENRHHMQASEGDDVQLEAMEGDEFKFFEPSHSSTVLDGLNTLRLAATFTDVRIKVDDSEFPVHKCVLTSFSPYFRAMFTAGLAESVQEVVTLNGVEAGMISSLIDYAYTGNIIIDKHNVQNLLSAANLLEVLPVRDACCQFLDKHMDETNCLGIHCFAEAHACTDLRNKAKSYVLKHFQGIVDQEEFLTITEAKLVEIVSSDDLEVDKEEAVFYAAVMWLNAQQNDKTARSFHKVLEHIRLPLLTAYFIHDVVERLPAVVGSPECRALVEEAKRYHLMPDRRAGVSRERTKARRSAGTVQVVVSVGGEDDKVVLRSVEYWDPGTKIWKTLNCLPFAVSKHGVVASGQGKMYMAGGEYPDGSASRSMWRYDPVLDKWEEMAGMRVPRSELGLAMLDGCVYAVGGWEGTSRLDSVERYDPETNAWSDVPPLKMAVTSPAVVACDGSLYVTGGAILEDGDGIELVQKYDTKTGGWVEVAAMLIARSGSAACVLDGFIYVVGGWHASTENTNKVERYDVARDRWEFVRPMAERRYRPGVSVINGRIYVLGGEEGWDRYHDTIECYSPDDDTWSTVGDMPTSRSWLSAVPLTIRRELGKEKS